MFHILLLTDFSDNAQNAIDYALNLFKKEECTFYLLHAYHDIPSLPGNRFDAENDLGQLLKRIKAKNDTPNYHFEMIFESDSVCHLVNSAVKDKRVDFVFMGTKGSSALREIFLGGTTVDLLKNLDSCPIVAVPYDYNYKQPEEIVLVSDFKHLWIASELAPLVTMAKLWGCKLIVLHLQVETELSGTQKMNKELLKNNLKGLKPKFLQAPMEETIASTLRRLEKKKSLYKYGRILKHQTRFLSKITS